MEKKQANKWGLYCIKNLVSQQYYLGKSPENKTLSVFHEHIKLSARRDNELHKEMDSLGKEFFLFYVIGYYEENVFKFMFDFWKKYFEAKVIDEI